MYSPGPDDRVDATPKTTRPKRFRLGYVLVLVAVIAFGVKFLGVAWHAHALAVQVSAVQTHLAQERANDLTLKHEIKNYERPSFVYQEARRWGYVLPGDRLVNIYYQHQVPHHHRVRAVKAHPVPTWRQWWDAFFGSSP